MKKVRTPTRFHYFEEKKRKTILYFTVEANEMQEMVWEKGAVSSAVTGLKPTNFYT